MALVRWALVIVMAIAAGGAWLHHFGTSAASSGHAETRYTCPMHPSVVTDGEGECPICGMALVPARVAPEASAAGAYTCPMHPAFVTDDAEARCPECHMKLVPKEAERVPGLARVELSPDRVQLMGMKTAVAAREPLGATLRVPGLVAPSEAAMASVSVRFGGFVEATPAQTGQRVEKGQVLATISTTELLAAQQALLSTVRWSERKPAGMQAPPSEALERDVRQRLEQSGVSPQDVEELLRIGEPLRTLTVRAPLSGHVTRKAVLAGAQVTPGQELFQLADLSTVWVLAEVPPDEVARVAPGQRVTFEVASSPGERFGGRVELVYPALNAGSRTLQARVAVANRGLRLRPGMWGDATIEVGAEPMVTIPAEALVDTGEQRYVFVDRGGGRFEPRAVRPGAARDGRVAVLEGLAVGERVVTTANFLLDSESRLRAAAEEPGPAGAITRADGERSDTRLP